MISQELEVSLHMAFVEARQQRHEFITVEHLLLALLDNPSAAEILRACAVDMDALRKSLVHHISESTPIVAGAEDVDTQPTLGFQRVIQRAIMHVQSTSNGKKEVTGANVLVAIFGEKDSHAVYFLHQQGLTRLDVVNFIAHGITKAGQVPPNGTEEPAAAESEGQAAGTNAAPQPTALDQYTINLNKLAAEGKIDPLIGREQEVERVVQVLCRRRKNILIAQLFEGVKQINLLHDQPKGMTSEDLELLRTTIGTFTFDVLGLKDESQQDAGHFEKLSGVVELLIAQRNKARERKDFATSDQIREELARLGIQLKDSKEGTTFSLS